MLSPQPGIGWGHCFALEVLPEAIQTDFPVHTTRADKKQKF
jgi:hypothetical protein